MVIRNRSVLNILWLSYSPTFWVKAKENQDRVPTLFITGYLNFIKIPIKQDLLLIIVLVRQQYFLNC